MARKVAPARKPGARQALARKKVLDYVRRLGLRKAAQRLEGSVKELREWLASGFPQAKLKGAVALGKPGGQYVYIKGSKLAPLIKERGLRAVATLTGIPGAQLKDLAKKRPKSAVRFDRDRLKKVVSKKGSAGIAKAIGTSPERVDKANRLPLTESARRLKRFAQHYGRDKAAGFLGISRRQLDSWVRKGIPRTWERDIDQRLGKKSDQGPDEADVKKARPAAALKKTIEAARKRAATWNKFAPKRFRISQADAERWARLGTFNDKFAAAKRAYEASKRPTTPIKRRPPPPKAPPRPILPAGITPAAPPGEKPPKPPRPPKKFPPPPPEPSKRPVDIGRDKKREFLQARVEAHVEGRYPRPDAPWGRIKRWRLINRMGIHVYRRVEKFVHDLDLVKLGTEIIALGKKVWNSLQGPQALMTIRFMFSAMGDGNPFYPDAFVEGDEANFFTRNLRIFAEGEIEPFTRELLNEIYMVDAEYVMLFLEYVEIVKSIPNPG